MFGLLKKKAPPDLSLLDTAEKVDELLRRSGLEKIYLVPLEFGGPETANNAVYVPAGIGRVNWGIDNNIIKPLIMAEKATKYVATVERQGKSLIPTVIHIVAGAPGPEFRGAVKIWGDAAA